MPCSHCGQAGHTYVKCPQLTRTGQRKRKKPSRKRKRRKVKRKMMRERAVEIYKNRDYTFVNNNMYEVAVCVELFKHAKNERKERDRSIRAMYPPRWSQELYNFVGFIG